METKNIAALLFLLAALLCHLRTGGARRSCDKSDITVAADWTGFYAFAGTVQRQPLYELEVGTSCSCLMKDVRISCGGLENSVEPLDASEVELHDGTCVLKKPVVRGSPVIFTYSSDVPVNFRVINATPYC
ncbi:hypothetical protein ACQJBY_071850 [Aegilops geniculata]